MLLSQSGNKMNNILMGALSVNVPMYSANELYLTDIKRLLLSYFITMLLLYFSLWGEREDCD